MPDTAEKEITPTKAFVLGAGLGTRLRPLTETLPKPLVPVAGKPLITHAFDHLIEAGIRSFVVNTHHAAEAYQEAFPSASYRGIPISFRHEPSILETAGGIANVRDLLHGDSPFLVYNGDIFTDIPLEAALRQHQASGAMVTLILRREGKQQHVAFDPTTNRITDIRGALGGGGQPCQFTGIYVVNPAFLDELEPGKKESVIPVFLRLIEEGLQIGGYLAEQGNWLDLGDRDSYLEAHTLLLDGIPMIDPEARVHSSAKVSGASVVARGCRVGADAALEDTILWENAQVEVGACLNRCVVRGGKTATGRHENVDF